MLLLQRIIPRRIGILNKTIEEYVKSYLNDDYFPDAYDPIKSLQSLARVLEPYDLQVELGQVVITGAYCRPVVSPGETYRATFSGIGSVEAHIV